MSTIENPPREDRIEYYRERANRTAAHARSLQGIDAQFEILIANAWQRLADYLDAGPRQSLPD